MFLDSAFLLSVGLILAGVLHLFLNEKNLKRFLVGKKDAIVFKAALFGIPLPLCSCSVLPMAHQLRKSGLSPGGTASFLISTPETGVDSIFLTYSLTDPLLTIARPVAAFLTALTSGLLINRVDDPALPITEETPACSDCSCEADNPGKNNTGFINKLISIFDYSCNSVLKDLAPYLFWGYLLAGIVAVIMGDNSSWIPETLRNGWGGYLGAIVIGLPMYICATSSTPLAAVLLASGFSPGAILVFLLVGPATNLASLAVVSKILNRISFVLYLSTIVVVSVFCGIITDYLYDLFHMTTKYQSGTQLHAYGIISHIFAWVLIFGILYYYIAKVIKRLK